MAMVGVDSGSLYRRTHSLSRMAWFWVGGRLAPFYIHQMNQVNSRNDWWQHHKHCLGIIIIIINIIIINNFLQFSWKMRKSWQYDMIATAISAQTVNWGSDNSGRSSSLTDRSALQLYTTTSSSSLTDKTRRKQISTPMYTTTNNPQSTN